nr:hypothetical protein [uncultured bacterium]
MKLRFAIRIMSNITCSMLLTNFAFGQASFQGLGDLPGGVFQSIAVDVSGDAQVIVGGGRTNSGPEACRWIRQPDRTWLLQPIGDLPGGSVSARADAASFDGSVVVGFGNSSKGNEAFRWTPTGGFEPLGDVGSGDFFSVASGVSPDGATVVGRGTGDNGSEPVIWPAGAGSAQALGGAFVAGFANAVSGDGSIVVGTIHVNDSTNQLVHAVRWDNGVMNILAFDTTPASQPNCSAVGISDNGKYVVGSNNGEAFILTAGGMTILGPGGATDVAEDGSRVVGVNTTSSIRAFIWDAATGYRDLKDHLTKDHSLDLTGWELHIAYGISNDGTTIVGQGKNPSGQIEGWVVVLPDADADGDGLFDDWEINGVPYTDINGDEQRYILDMDGDRQSDADPMHKDLFVELDMMSGLTFPQDAIDAVAFAFEAAPLMNPDGTEGIALHIVVDDTTLPFERVTQTPNKNWPPNAPQLKADWFGTDQERSDASSTALLDAKGKAYRYAIQFNEASESIGGLGEILGDDFVTFSGQYSNIDKAAVFMHELGHTLGLRHGGVDDTNGKPNYPSIMNYVLAYKQPWSASFWRLDFSREDLPMMDEANLDEAQPVGSAYYHNFMMPYFGIVPNGAACFPPAQWGNSIEQFLSLDRTATTDFNLDCDDQDIGVAADLNYLPSAGLPGSVQPSPNQLFAGWNDWPHVQLPVTSGGGSFAGPVPPDEPTESQIEYMRENFSIPPGVCISDINSSSSTDVADLLMIINSWGPCVNIAVCPGDIAPNAGVGDGQVNVADLLAIINAWGPCR